MNVAGTDGPWRFRDSGKWSTSGDTATDDLRGENRPTLGVVLDTHVTSRETLVQYRERRRDATRFPVMRTWLVFVVVTFVTVIMVTLVMVVMVAVTTAMVVLIVVRMAFSSTLAVMRVMVVRRCAA